MKLVATDKSRLRQSGDVFECEDKKALLLIENGSAVMFEEEKPKQQKPKKK